MQPQTLPPAAPGGGAPGLQPGTGPTQLIVGGPIGGPGPVPPQQQGFPGQGGGGLGGPLPPPLPGQPQGLVKRRLCAEVCLELLCAEAVRHFAGDARGGQQQQQQSQVELEAIGVRIGRQLVERHVRDKPRLGDTLEIIKYICKEFWPFVFKKGIDNLRTNHRGVYVLQDNAFKWLMRLSPAPAAPGVPPDLAQQEAARRLAAKHLILPSGILKGALCQLGITCTVEADCSAVPRCAFTVKIA